jgi:outer membrane protein OmpA-like peptidoglycan-associated protein
MPVMTKDGNCVINNWEGSEDCKAAKEAAHERPYHDMGVVVYFDFNKSSLTPQAKLHLDRLAHKLRWEHMERVMHKDHKGRKHWVMEHHHTGETITVIGYADRIGNGTYNQKLAMKRAEAVRDYLISKGAVRKASKIEVRSLGSEDSHSSCPAHLPRAKLINCLRTDRRVEIEVSHHQ